MSGVTLVPYKIIQSFQSSLVKAIIQLKTIPVQNSDCSVLVVTGKSVLYT